MSSVPPSPRRIPDEPDETDETDELPPEAYAAALATVPGIGPKTMRVLLDGTLPRDAYEAVRAGRVRAGGAPRGRILDARGVDVAEVWRAHVRAGVRVRLIGTPDYPRVLAADPEAPAVIFSLGDTGVLDARGRVAIVGTRSATRYGLGVAAQLGADLAAAGVVVVSGLARGIDGAAHEGAVAAWQSGRRARADAPPQMPGAPPVAVVAGDVASPYPRQHAGLWRRVSHAGAVLSEAPVGAADVAWRFPVRNRVIAALSDIVVVVECHSAGGALHTVRAATARGVPVGAVPGSIRSPASAGANSLLADGCFVVRDTADVLVALSLATAARPAPARGRVGAAGTAGSPRVRSNGAGDAPAPAAARPASTPAASTPPVAAKAAPEAAAGPGAAVLDALGWERCALDELVERTGLGLGAVCHALESLRAQGVVHGLGGWWERV